MLFSEMKLQQKLPLNLMVCININTLLNSITIENFNYHFLIGELLGDRYIKVDRPMTPKILQPKASTDVIRPAGCKTVFIKNLPYDCTEEEIQQSFRVFGKILNIRLAVWGHKKQLKGFGYVEYKSEESAEIAVKKSGTVILKDRVIVCDFETGQPKGSFRTVEGKAWSKTLPKKRKKLV